MTETKTNNIDRLNTAREAVSALTKARAAHATATAKATPSDTLVRNAAVAVAALMDEDGMRLADIAKVLPNVTSLAGPTSDGKAPSDAKVSRIVNAGRLVATWDEASWDEAIVFANRVGVNVTEAVAAQRAVVNVMGEDKAPTIPWAGIRASLQDKVDAIAAENARKRAVAAAKRADARTPKGRAIGALAALASVGPADWDALAEAATGNAALLGVITTARTLSDRVPMSAEGDVIVTE